MPENVSANGDNRERKTIKIGYIDYEGFINQNDDGTYSGYGVELLNEIAKYTGWRYEYIFDTFANQLEALKSGEIDFICHAQKTPEREQNYYFSKYSSGSESSVMYVRKEDDRFYYNDYGAFMGITVAFLNNSYQNNVFSEYAKIHHFYYSAKNYDSQHECFEALDRGEVDAVVMGSLGGIDGYKVVSLVGSDPFYFMTGRMNAELLNTLDTALGEIYAVNPIYEANLFSKYYGNKSASSELLLTREEAAYIALRHNVTIGFMSERSPLSERLRDDKAEGMLVDLMDLIAKKTGLRFEYKFLDTGETGYQFLNAGKGDLVVGVASSVFSTPNEALLQSSNLQENSIVFVGKKGTEFNMEAELTVALPAGFINGEKAILAVYPNFKFYKGDTNEDCLKAIRDGKADVMLQNLYIIRECLQSPLYEDLEIFPAYTFDENEKIVALPENATLLSIINKAISVISKDEANDVVIAHTIAKRYHTDISEIIYKYRVPLMGIVFLIVLILFMLIMITIIRQHNYIEIEKVNRQIESTNKNLKEAVLQAGRASTAKSQFLSRMSHEIRTPMNAIVGITEIARNHEDDKEKMDEYLDKIATSSKVLLNIINDVLDMSAIESNKMKIAHEEFSIKKILDEISTIYFPQCQEKGVNFQIVRDVKHNNVIGDSLRVSQILLNLVSNAYKFTQAGGNISLEARETTIKDGNVFIRFVVSDTGCGMSEDMQARLFKPFEQESASTAKEHGGSGLGTSIARNLVSMMHGAIDVVSEKDKGSTFTIDIPFAFNETNQETGEDGDSISQELKENLSDKKTYDFTGYKVLLAEDQDLNAEIAQELLGLASMNSDRAKNGKEALEIFENSAQGTYSLILMDIQMPEMNGYEATHAIRALPREDAKTIPIYAMTANAFTEDVSNAIAAGMNGHIAKPIDSQLLYQTMKEVIQKRNKD